MWVCLFIRKNNYYCLCTEMDYNAKPEGFCFRFIQRFPLKQMRWHQQGLLRRIIAKCLICNLRQSILALLSLWIDNCRSNLVFHENASFVHIGILSNVWGIPMLIYCCHNTNYIGNVWLWFTVHRCTFYHQVELLWLFYFVLFFNMPIGNTLT